MTRLQQGDGVEDAKDRSITLLARKAADRRERDDTTTWTTGVIPEISVLGG